MHPGRDSARQTVALSSRSAPIGDYFSRAGRRSNSPGNAWLADSRMLIVALPDNGVGSIDFDHGSAARQRQVG